MAWESAIIQALQRNIGSFCVFIASCFTLLGEEAVIVVVMGFIYWAYDKDLGRDIALCLLSGITLNTMLKNVFVRRRPYFDNPDIKCLKPVSKDADIFDIAAQGHSFPSGHSTNGVTVYTALGLKFKKKILLILSMVIPLVIGLSRIVLGVHYPTDVICGWALGLAVIFLLAFLKNHIKDIRLIYLIITAISLTGVFYCKTSDYYSALGMLIGFCLADLFEEKYVRFESTRNPFAMILRTAAGIVIFALLNALLKLPFSSDFLAGASAAAHALRTVRYTVTVFAVIGIYPCFFKKMRI